MHHEPQEIQKRMRDHKSTMIARRSGVHINHVRRVRNGLVPNIGVLTAASIWDALDELDVRKAKLQDASDGIVKYSVPLIAEESGLPVGRVFSAKNMRDTVTDDEISFLLDAIRRLDLSERGDCNEHNNDARIKGR